MKRLLLLIAAAAALSACQKEPGEQSSGLPLLSINHRTVPGGDAITPPPTHCGGLFEAKCYTPPPPPIYHPQPWQYGGSNG